MGEQLGVVLGGLVAQRTPTDGLGHPDDGVGQDGPMLGGQVDVDHVGHGVRHVLEDGLGDLGELSVVADGGPEKQPEGRPVARDEAEVGGHAVLDPFPTAVGRHRCGRDFSQQPAADVLQ